MKLTKILKTVALVGTLMTTQLGYSSEGNQFVISTGSSGGGYEGLGHSVAEKIKQQAKRYKSSVEPVVINTNGTIQNIENLNDGLSQGAIVQADGLNVYPVNRPNSSKKAHTETVFWLYNKKHDYKDLEDIEGSEDAVIVIAEGSGGFITLSSFAKEDSGYENNLDSLVFAEDNYEAASIAAEGRYKGKKVAGMLYVGSVIPSEITTDFSRDLGVGELTDGDFNDAEDAYGESLYTKCVVEPSQINSMSTSSWGNPDTICLKALFVYLTDFQDNNTKKAVSKGISKALRNLR